MYNYYQFLPTFLLHFSYTPFIFLVILRCNKARVSSTRTATLHYVAYGHICKLCMHYKTYMII
jgi:hypothetical protein